MAEWLKAHAWKACLGETLTWVRIPLSPPVFTPHKHWRLPNIPGRNCAILRERGHARSLETIQATRGTTFQASEFYSLGSVALKSFSSWRTPCRLSTSFVIHPMLLRTYNAMV